jgi:HEAT repeat protein
MAGVGIVLGAVVLCGAAQPQEKEPESKPLKALIKDLGSAEPEVRRNAVVGLAELGKAAAEAVPDLVRVLANPQEDRNVRQQAALALVRVGKVPPAEKAIPTLVEVLRDKGNVAAVRERTLWALRVHGKDLEKYPDFCGALAGIVAEPRHLKNRMLRYDAAFLLGMLKRGEAPKEALDVLLDFLNDDTIRVYMGTNQNPVDGRVLAVQALREIGPKAVRARKDILTQLRALFNNPLTLPSLRLELEKAQSKIGDLSAENP